MFGRTHSFIIHWWHRNIKYCYILCFVWIGSKSRGSRNYSLLFNEIRDKIAKHGGQLSAEAIQEMIYLEGVLLEGMRMHPPLMVMAKTCTQEYTLPKTSGQFKAVTIQPGTVVNIPVLGIHMDSKYYPNPDDSMRKSNGIDTKERFWDLAKGHAFVLDSVLQLPKSKSLWLTLFKNSTSSYRQTKNQLLSIHKHCYLIQRMEL